MRTSAYVLALFIVGSSNAASNSTGTITFDDRLVNKAGEELGDYFHTVTKDLVRYGKAYERNDKVLGYKAKNVWTKEAHDVKESVEDALDSVTRVSTGSNSTGTISIDDRKVNKIGKEAGEVAEKVVKDLQQHERRKKQIEDKLIDKMNTKWAKEG